MFDSPSAHRVARAIAMVAPCAPCAACAAALIQQIASQPIVTWLGDWWTTPLLVSKLDGMRASALTADRTPVLVTCAIPGRDCGGYSAGGHDAAQYVQWNRT